MRQLQNLAAAIKPWLAKAWVQWLLATMFFFFMSWFFMGSAITHCANNTTALGSDSTGGFAWMQWSTGNGLSWSHTDKSNYPFGENLNQPQYITSAVFIILYKLFATLTTPICGLNLLQLLAYMSTGLLMFGLVRWLLRRNDIALFAGFAAAFVPFHQLKSQSHINYMYGSTFIAIIWTFLWFLRRPTYKKALILSAISAIGFYFDGYFILFTAVLVGSLFISPVLVDAVRLLRAKKRSTVLREALDKIKYLALASVCLAVLLIPILVTYKNNGAQINQSLALVRSEIKSETKLYGTRPIEFVIPSYNSALMPPGYASWRATKLHGSNFSEATLYVGYTVIILAIVSLAALLYRRFRKFKVKEFSYPELIFILVFAFLACFALSLPAKVFLFGHDVDTPVLILTKLTSSWRTLSRFFLAMDPIIIILASVGLYVITKNRTKKIQLAIVLVAGLLLFAEYLPAPLYSASNLYNNAPPVYKQLRQDHHATLVAEYPLASFVYTPEIFTYQPVTGKTLLNANNGGISRGPFDDSIAGLNDPQTLGALQQLHVDVIVTHGFASENSNLKPYYPLRQPVKPSNVKPSSIYSYTINKSVPGRQETLAIKRGAESLSVDSQQISHRYITSQATMGLMRINSQIPSGSYEVSFRAESVCPVSANITISQSGHTIWQAPVSKQPMPINLIMNGDDFQIKTADCSVGITYMDVEPAN